VCHSELDSESSESKKDAETSSAGQSKQDFIQAVTASLAFIFPINSSVIIL